MIIRSKIHLGGIENNKMKRDERPITVTIVGEITEKHQIAWAERLSIILEKQYGIEGCKQILEGLKKEG